MVCKKYVAYGGGGKSLPLYKGPPISKYAAGTDQKESEMQVTTWNVHRHVPKLIHLVDKLCVSHLLVPLLYIRVRQFRWQTLRPLCVRVMNFVFVESPSRRYLKTAMQPADLGPFCGLCLVSVSNSPDWLSDGVADCVLSCLVLLVAGKWLTLFDRETDCSVSHWNKRERAGSKQVSFSILLEEQKSGSAAVFRPLKTWITVSPYRAVNTLRLGYKNQSVNAV
jgi:hypothetical protein